MKRTALVLAELELIAAVLLYFVGTRAVMIAAPVFCMFAAVSLIFRTRLGFKPAAVFVLGALFCLYLLGYHQTVVEADQSLVGQSRTMVCTVTEEPDYGEGYVCLSVKADTDRNETSEPSHSPRFMLYIRSDAPGYDALEGDILSVDVTFKELDRTVRKYRYADRVYVSTYCDGAEIVGHEETLYTKIIAARRAIKSCIDRYLTDDCAALLKGLLLGDISNMSDELYTCFKTTGVAHITAVSGVHIGAFCTMFVTLLSFFFGRRKASALALIPLCFVVAAAGITPSAVRAGIMCAIMLLGNLLLYKTDSLNSLGVAVAAMLIVNPFYICSLSFQLSCTAAAGVILVTPYGTTAAKRLAKFKSKYLRKATFTAVLTFLQSVGAVVFTLPIQILSFGYISLVAPVSSVLVCVAAVYTMVISVVGMSLSFIPYVGIIAIVPFKLSQFLLTYIIAVVRILAKLPFSYIPFGRRMAVLWIGLTLAFAGLWYLLGQVGGVRTLAVAVSALLILSLVSEKYYSRGIVEAALLDTGDGFCAVISSGEKCIIIGCGDSSSDYYVIENHLKLRGITEVTAVFLPSGHRMCAGGLTKTAEELKPDAVVLPEGVILFPGALTAYDGAVFDAGFQNIKIKAVACDCGCVYEASCYDKTFLVGISSYDAADLGLSRADFVLTGRAVPEHADAPITVISGRGEPDKTTVEQCGGRVLCTDGKTVTVKLKMGKEVSAYAEW